MLCAPRRLHDYDNNDNLDGTEIMAAISHIMPHDDDLDLGKLGEGHVLTPDEKRRLYEAKQRRDDQLNLFISAFFFPWRQNNLL